MRGYIGNAFDIGAMIRELCEEGYPFETRRELRSDGEHEGVEFVSEPVASDGPEEDYAQYERRERKPRGYARDVLCLVLLTGSEHIESCRGKGDAESFAQSVRAAARRMGVEDKTVVKRLGGWKVSVRGRVGEE